MDSVLFVLTSGCVAFCYAQVRGHGTTTYAVLHNYCTCPSTHTIISFAVLWLLLFAVAAAVAVAVAASAPVTCYVVAYERFVFLFAFAVSLKLQRALLANSTM